MPDIVESYLGWLKDMAHVEQGDDSVYVSLPYLDRHNDYCGVWISQEDEHHYRLSDDSRISREFRSVGCNLNEPTRIRTLVVNTLTSFNLPVEWVDAKEFIIVVHSKELPGKLNSMLQAMVILSHLAEVAVWAPNLKESRMSRTMKSNPVAGEIFARHDDLREPT